jgi:acyl-CoA thioester hydrolase
MESLVYSHDIVVQSKDLDELDHVNNVVYLQWVQDAASAHWNTYASQAVKEKYFWVVLRHEIDYKAPALLGDEIIAKTWVENYSGAKSTRIVQLLRKRDEVLLAEACTTWCLMGRQTGRPVRVGDDIRNVFTEKNEH